VVRLLLYLTLFQLPSVNEVANALKFSNTIVFFIVMLSVVPTYIAEMLIELANNASFRHKVKKDFMISNKCYQLR